MNSVILTRSEKENRRIAPVFEREGFRVVSAPTIELRSLDVDIASVRQVLERGAGVILASGFATARWLELRASLLADLPVECYLVVGRRSAALLKRGDRGTPIVAVADSAAELLQSAVAFPSRILYPGSRARREDLVLGLRLRGCQVVDHAMYEPAPPADGGRAFDDALRETDGACAIAFFSPSAVEGMRSLAITLPTGTVIGAIGATTAAALNRNGFYDIILPERPVPELLAQALARRLAECTSR